MPEATTKTPEYSTNDRAERAMGRRDDDGPIGIVPLWPVEMGYSCPVHKQSIEVGPELLHWSEYNSFLWCELCDRDNPSALCATDLEHAVKVFLDSVELAIERSAHPRPAKKPTALSAELG